MTEPFFEDVKARLAYLFGLRQDAEATLNDPGLQRAFADCREAAHDTFANSAPNQIEERDNAYWLLRALDGLEASLTNRINAHELESQLAQKAAARNTAHALRRSA